MHQCVFRACCHSKIASVKKFLGYFGGLLQSGPIRSFEIRQPISSSATPPRRRWVLNPGLSAGDMALFSQPRGDIHGIALPYEASREVLSFCSGSQWPAQSESIQKRRPVRDCSGQKHIEVGAVLVPVSVELRGASSDLVPSCYIVRARVIFQFRRTTSAVDHLLIPSRQHRVRMYACQARALSKHATKCPNFESLSSHMCLRSATLCSTKGSLAPALCMNDRSSSFLETETQVYSSTLPSPWFRHSTPPNKPSMQIKVNQGPIVGRALVMCHPSSV